MHSVNSPQIIIGFAGYAGSGKDTAAKPLIDMLGFKRLAFADAIKDMLFIMNPIIPFQKSTPALDANGHHILGKSTSETVLANLQFLVNNLGWDNAKQISEVRRLQQRLGTEAGRNILGPNCWKDIVKRQLITDEGERLEQKALITDVRFDNEFELVWSLGGYVIRLHREGVEAKNGHISDTTCDKYVDQCININNNGTEEELHGVIIDTLQTILETKHPKHKVLQQMKSWVKTKCD